MAESVVNRLRSMTEDLIRDKKLLIRIMLVLLILAAAFILRLHDSSKADITVEVADEKVQEQTEAIYVDIGGAVAKPGVYKADTETRLYEVIEMAGGLRSDADTDLINQAAFVQDGEKIMIPIHSDHEQGEDKNTADSTYTVPSSGQSDKTGLVNINSATREELESLSGIGEVMAGRIIEYRNGNRFKSKEDIKSVKGIGDAIYEKIKDNITI